MKNILLTGATGFLGKILQPSLKKEGYQVLTLGRSSSNDYHIDLSTEVPKFNDSFDIIIHAAGKAHSVPKTPEDEKAFYDVNYEGTVNLCKAIDAMDTKPKAFIFISTVAVYGLEEGEGILESQPLLGTSPYAKSKIQAEAYLERWAKGSNIILGILRLPLIAGPNPIGNLGAMIKGIQTGRYLSIGKAEAMKSIIWAEDIAAIITKLSEIGGTYNLTDGQHPTFGELENEIAKSLGKKKPVKIPLWFAQILGKIGDLLGSRAPINTDKINKITTTLTFNDLKARKELDFQSTKVLNKIAEIVRANNVF